MCYLSILEDIAFKFYSKINMCIFSHIVCSKQFRSKWVLTISPNPICRLGDVWGCVLTCMVYHCYIHWPIVTNPGQDNWECPHMSSDFDLCLTFGIDIEVNVKFGGYIFYASRKSDFFLVSRPSSFIMWPKMAEVAKRGIIFPWSTSFHHFYIHWSQCT